MSVYSVPSFRMVTRWYLMLPQEAAEVLEAHAANLRPTPKSVECKSSHPTCNSFIGEIAQLVESAPLSRRFGGASSMSWVLYLFEVDWNPNVLICAHVTF